MLPAELFIKQPCFFLAIASWARLCLAHTCIRDNRFPALPSTVKLSSRSHKQVWKEPRLISVESALFSPCFEAGSAPCFRGDAARTRFAFLLCSWSPGHQQAPLCPLLHLAPGQLCPKPPDSAGCPNVEEEQLKGYSSGGVEEAVSVALLSTARAGIWCTRVIEMSEVGLTHSFLQPKSESGKPLLSCW